MFIIHNYLSLIYINISTNEFLNIYFCRMFIPFL
ncbi:hypothetical protein BE25_0216 [Staphylococcus phage vB_SepM_BE25]|nr:hypothetical protein BE25_0216 [Staphylococcus phage vB_SepM_BE25]